jgi:hypothetical protein
MSRYAREPENSGDFEYQEAPTGTHVAICYRVIDLGTQHGEYGGEEQIRNQVLVQWELPEELMTDGRPFSVSRFYTNSLHEKATLRKDLAAWRGRDFTEKELAGFDLASIIGKGCLVSVVKTQKGKSKVGAVLALPKGTKVPKLVNEPVTFFIDEWDNAVWEKLTKGLKGMIQKSDEYQERMHGSPLSNGDEPSMPIDTDDIPF